MGKVDTYFRQKRGKASFFVGEYLSENLGYGLHCAEYGFLLNLMIPKPVDLHAVKLELHEKEILDLSLFDNFRLIYKRILCFLIVQPIPKIQKNTQSREFGRIAAFEAACVEAEPL